MESPNVILENPIYMTGKAESELQYQYDFFLLLRIAKPNKLRYWKADPFYFKIHFGLIFIKKISSLMFTEYNI